MNTSPSPAQTPPARTSPLGMTIASYWVRASVGKKPPAEAAGVRFATPIEQLEYTRRLGAVGYQLGLEPWDAASAQQLRTTAESWGMYLEGQTALPWQAADLDAFEARLVAARRAGIGIVRTVAMSGRRYESLGSVDDFRAFRTRALHALERAEPIARRHGIRLAVENHKDWRVDEQVDVLRRLSSEFIGATLDFGNNIALLEDPLAVARQLAPYVLTTHFKDMAVAPADDGFVLSEVPLGRGWLDLKSMIDVCRAANPAIRLNLEMITRDPLPIRCLTPGYWATLDKVPAARLAEALRAVRDHPPSSPLPRTTGLSLDGQLALEEANNLECLEWARINLAG